VKWEEWEPGKEIRTDGGAKKGKREGKENTKKEIRCLKGGCFSKQTHFTGNKVKPERVIGQKEIRDGGGEKGREGRPLKSAPGLPQNVLSPQKVGLWRDPGKKRKKGCSWWARKKRGKRIQNHQQKKRKDTRGSKNWEKFVTCS